MCMVMHIPPAPGAPCAHHPISHLFQCSSPTSPSDRPDQGDHHHQNLSKQWQENSMKQIAAIGYTKLYTVCKSILTKD